MAAEEELELEERDIFDVGTVPASSQDTLKGDISTDEPGAASSTDDEATASTCKEPAFQMPGPPRPMIARKIRRSLDTAAARHIRSSSRDAEEEGGDTVEDTAGLSWLASSARHGKPLFGVRSLPVSHAKLGTSAPINIPTQSWRQRSDSSNKADKLPSTFQPPHLIGHQEEDRQGRSAGSFAGQVGSATVKRSRLQQRNAILQSTGFLERVSAGPGGATGPSLGAIQETQPQDITRMPGHCSALSQRLGASPSPRTSSPSPLTQSLHQCIEPAPLA